MDEIEYEGQKYLLKSKVDEIVRSRVSPYTQRATTAEQRATELQTQLDQVQAQAGQAQTLQTRVTELEGELGKATGMGDRLRAAMKAGVNDLDSLDVLEFAHQRAMRGVEAAQQQDFGTWLDAQKAAGDKAPDFVRALLPQQAAPPAPTPAPAPPAPGVPPWMQHAPAPAPSPAPGQPGAPTPAPAPAPPAPAPAPPWQPAGAGQFPANPTNAGGGPIDVSQANDMDALRVLIAQHRAQTQGG